MLAVTPIPRELATRVARAAVAHADAEVWRPSAAADAPDGAATIEAALIAGDASRALAAAEQAAAAHPDASAPRVYLAWALCAAAQPTAALDQLRAAAALANPGTGAIDRDPMRAYATARAEQLAFEHAAGAIAAVPPLVTTADLAVVTLARGDGGDAWFTGPIDLQLSGADVRAAIGEHREVNARCLAVALDALDAAPGFVEAAYLAARIAVKLGMVTSGRALFDAVAPRITGRPDADAFARDRRDLADPTEVVAAATKAPLPPTARKPRGLRVIS